MIIIMCKKNEVIIEKVDIKKKPIIPYQPKFKLTKLLLIIFENLRPYPIEDNKKTCK